MVECSQKTIATTLGTLLALLAIHGCAGADVGSPKTAISIAWPDAWIAPPDGAGQPEIRLTEDPAPTGRSLSRRWIPQEWRASSARDRREGLNAWQAARTEPRMRLCYRGHGASVAAYFFGQVGAEDVAIEGIDELLARFSRDGKAVSMEYREHGLASWKYLRISRCSGPTNDESKSSSPVDSRGFIESLRNRVPAENSPELWRGREVMDHAPEGAPRGPGFSLKDDYPAAAAAIERERARLPWNRADLDLKTQKNALRFAYRMLAYVYEGMADNADPERAFDPRGASRYWCEAPWMGDLPDGRDYAHGLTAAGSLLPSERIYPQAGSPPSPRARQWSIGFFNAWGCQVLNEVFPDSRSARSPDWTKAHFPENTVAFKLLGTPATFDRISEPSGETFSGIGGALTWLAHVSPTWTEPTRRLVPVHLFQLDISVRVAIRGTRADLGNWVMLVYDFDDRFNLDDQPEWRRSGYSGSLAPGLEHMRPLGLQVGLDDGESKLFFRKRGMPVTNNDGNRLDGAADVRTTSCMGCHTTAGTGRDGIPGYASNREFLNQAAAGAARDFVLHMEVVRRNYETRASHR